MGIGSGSAIRPNLGRLAPKLARCFPEEGVVRRPKAKARRHPHPEKQSCQEAEEFQPTWQGDEKRQGVEQAERDDACAGKRAGQRWCERMEPQVAPELNDRDDRRGDGAEADGSGEARRQSGGAGGLRRSERRTTPSLRRGREPEHPDVYRGRDDLDDASRVAEQRCPRALGDVAFGDRGTRRAPRRRLAHSSVRMRTVSPMSKKRKNGAHAARSGG